MQYTCTLKNGTVLTSTFENGTLTEKLERGNGMSASATFVGTAAILDNLINFAVTAGAEIAAGKMPEQNMAGVLGLMEFHDQVAEALIPLDSISDAAKKLADNTIGTVNRRAVPQQQEGGYQA